MTHRMAPRMLKGQNERGSAPPAPTRNGMMPRVTGLKRPKSSALPVCVGYQARGLVDMLLAQEEIGAQSIDERPAVSPPEAVAQVISRDGADQSHGDRDPRIQNPGRAQESGGDDSDMPGDEDPEQGDAFEKGRQEQSDIAAAEGDIDQRVLQSGEKTQIRHITGTVYHVPRPLFRQKLRDL